MVSRIRNPIEWIADQLGNAFEYIESTGETVSGPEDEPAEQMPNVRRIRVGDLREVLRKGVEDFMTFRSDVVVICLLYPIIGVFVTWFAFDRNLVPLVFPLIAGFVLIGPFAAVGMYEMSRRREQGKEASWADLFRVVSSPSFGAIIVLGLILLGIFGIWLLAAQGIYNATLGPEPPESLGWLIIDAFTTGAGWMMIILGGAVGLLFALLVLTISVVSFPLLLDRPVGLPAAIVTSMRVAARNPKAIGAWGLTVAGLLAAGTLPFFLGLIVIVPILGHATWHLYRRAVE